MCYVEKYGRLFLKILFYFICIALVPIIILGSFILFFSNTITIRNVQSQVLRNVEVVQSSFESILNEYMESLEMFCNDPEVILSLKAGGNNPEFRKSIYQKISLVMAGRFDKSIMYVFNKENTFSIATNTKPLDYDPVLFENWGVFRALKNNPYKVVLFL